MMVKNKEKMFGRDDSLGFLQLGLFFGMGVFVLMAILSFNSVFAIPLAASDVVVAANETINSSSGGTVVNISGGYIATVNVTAVTQNPRWKGIVGNVTGSFTLDDAAGSTLYEWSSTSVSGEVYAARNGSSISWTSVNCSNVTWMEQENYRLNHTNSDDNITATFDATDNTQFFLGSTLIAANTCPTINTFVSDAAPVGDEFEEVILYDSAGQNAIFATIMEQDQTGFDDSTYDFQMIVPEIGYAGFDGATAYYLFVELS